MSNQWVAGFQVHVDDESRAVSVGPPIALDVTGKAAGIWDSHTRHGRDKLWVLEIADHWDDLFHADNVMLAFLTVLSGEFGQMARHVSILSKMDQPNIGELLLQQANHPMDGPPSLAAYLQKLSGGGDQ